MRQQISFHPHSWRGNAHRREIVVVFCDLRGFTGFAERAEPEEVMALLRDYHAAMGPIVARFEGKTPAVPSPSRERREVRSNAAFGTAG